MNKNSVKPIVALIALVGIALTLAHVGSAAAKVETSPPPSPSATTEPSLPRGETEKMAEKKKPAAVKKSTTRSPGGTTATMIPSKPKGSSEKSVKTAPVEAKPKSKSIAQADPKIALKPVPKADLKSSKSAPIKPATPLAKSTATAQKTATKPLAKTAATSPKSAGKPLAKPASTRSESAAKPPLDLTAVQEKKLLALLNGGTTEDLSKIKGITSTRAEAIASARPFQKVNDIILVPGIGDATFEQILKHGRALTQPVPKSAKS